jgi:hypothetical protein
MKQFLLKLVFFVLPLLILAYPIDLAISYFLRQSNEFHGEFEVMNDIYNSKANCDVAIYGSSRAMVHFDPKIIGDSLGMTVYNFGIDGHNFWMQYLRHLEHVKYNEKPKIIIFSLGMFTLQKRANLYNPEQFLPYMLWDKNIMEYTQSYIGYKKIDYYVPLIRYAGKYEAFKTSIDMLLKIEPVIPTRNKGFSSFDKEWNLDLEIAKAKIGTYRVECDAKSIALFEQFIQECKSNNIMLLLVYAPEFIEGQNFVTNRSDVISIYNELAQKYKIKFYDFSTDVMSLDKKLFYNSNHLNKKGAELFSSTLAHDLKVQLQNEGYAR